MNLEFKVTLLCWEDIYDRFSCTGDENGKLYYLPLCISEKIGLMFDNGRFLLYTGCLLYFGGYMFH